MKVSAQEEYGLRCMLRLASKGKGGSLTITELSQLEGISAPNVAKMMRLMRRAGFAKSTRGQAGGYALARAANQINVGEVLATLGGRLFDPSFCDRHSGLEKLCTHLPSCSVRSLWRIVQGAVDQVLGKLALSDLICTEEEMSAWAASSPAVTLTLPRPS